MTPIILSGPGAATLETLELDAAGSNLDGTDPGTALLLLGAGSNYWVAPFNWPAPQPKLIWAGSIDTDGSQRADPATYENRTITLTVEAADTASSSTNENNLRAKCAKIHREGGTLKWTRKDSAVRIFDLLANDSLDPVRDIKYENGRAEFTIVFSARPGARGASVTNADRVETTLAALVATETATTGDLAAYAKWVIDNDATAGNDWWGLLWGVEVDRDYAFTASTGSGALLYEAESRTAMGGSAIAVGPTGASGAGSNVMRNTALATSYQAVLSTQATAAGAHLSHVGQFSVWTKVQVPTSNTGTVSVALEWGEGDFRRFTQNATRTLDPTWEGTWRLLDLGLVNISKVAQGTQRWEGRILAKSTAAGDDIDVDFFMLVPVDEGSGVASATFRVPTPTSFGARDEFDQTAGALAAKTLPVGGTWSGAGDADDFNVEATAHIARRAAVSDVASTGRQVLAGTGTYTGVVAQADMAFDTTAASGVTRQGLIVRWVDASNFAYATISRDHLIGVTSIDLRQRVAGVTSVLASIIEVFSTSRWYTLRVTTDASGRWWLSSAEQGTTLQPIGNGQAAILATAGTLASGRVGLYDENTSTVPINRDYDNFAAWAHVGDAAVFAGQSMEVRHNQIIREDATGTIWQKVSDSTGSYLRLPPAGLEGHSLRLIAKPLYHPEDIEGVRLDDRLDDISGRLTFHPLYL